MNDRGPVVLASAGIVGIFLLVQLGALALVEPFQQEGHQVVENTGDPTISIVYIAAMVVVTGLMLLGLKYGGTDVLRGFIILSGVYISFYVFQVIVPSWATVTVAGTAIDLLAIGAALLLGGALLFYPEWYVIDASGIVMGIGAAGLFGVNFGILPALVLLVVLAVYDAISVYGTEHMLTLASGVMEMRVPVVLVVPLSLSYSFLEEGAPDHVSESENGENQEAAEDTAAVADVSTDGVGHTDDDTGDETEQTEGENEDIDRGALFIGLGDAVIPAVLVVSASFFIETGSTISLLGISATLPAVTAMIGTIAGLVVLLWMVLQGKAHAGLPLLNGGTIAGYLIGALITGLPLVEALGLDSVL